MGKPGGAPWTYQVSMAFTSSLLFTTLLIATRHPACYRRIRTPLLLVFRSAAWAAPNARGMHGLPQMLQRPAGAGPQGLLADSFRIWIGCRASGLLVPGMSLPLPPLLELAVQALSLWQTRAPYCSQQLLRDPVWQQRQAALFGSGGGHGCHRFLLFLRLTSALATVAFAARCFPPHQLHAYESSGRRPQQWSHEQQCHELARVCLRGAALYAAANAWLHRLLVNWTGMALLVACSYAVAAV